MWTSRTKSFHREGTSEKYWQGRVQGASTCSTACGRSSNGILCSQYLVSSEARCKSCTALVPSQIQSLWRCTPVSCRSRVTKRGAHPMPRKQRSTDTRRCLAVAASRCPGVQVGAPQSTFTQTKQLARSTSFPSTQKNTTSCAVSSSCLLGGRHSICNALWKRPWATREPPKNAAGRYREVANIVALAAHPKHLEFVVRCHLTDDLYSITQRVGSVRAYVDRLQRDCTEVAPGLSAMWVDYVCIDAVGRRCALGPCAQRLSAEDRSVALWGCGRCHGL